MSDCKLITLWIPKELLPSIDQAIRKLDTDRSKFIRQAVREKMRQAGVVVPDGGGL